MNMSYTTLKKCGLCSIITCAIVFFTGSIFSTKAQVRIIPPIQEMRIWTPQLLLDNLTIKGTVKNSVVEVHYRQDLRNRFQHTIEGEYIFPVPSGASVSEFVLEQNGKKLKGEILDAKEARTRYREIVRKLVDPALLEYIGQKLMRVKIFPIPPGENATITFDYSHISGREAGMVKIVLPVATVSTNYPPQKASIAVELAFQDSRGIENIYSPSHKIDIVRRDNEQVTVGIEQSETSLTSDIILYYGYTDEKIAADVLFHHEKGEDGYFLLLLSPTDRYQRQQILEKDVIFVIDKSGSMEGEKIEQVKDALKFSLENLNNNDRFNIIKFSTGITQFQEKLVLAENLREAGIEFCGAIEAEGGTNLHEALLSALAMTESSTNPCYIVFLTDGLPTVGKTNISEIVKDVTGRSGENVRIFNFGVGVDVNTHLLDLLAEENSGVSTYIQPGERIDRAVKDFMMKIAYPAMTDVKLQFNQIAAYNVYPKDVHDLFEGDLVSVVGRYSASGKSTLSVKGRLDKESVEYTHEVEFPETETENDFLPRLWATRKVGYLLDNIRLHGENQELVDEIKKIGLKYGILTPYTSFLAEEDVIAGLRWQGLPEDWRGIILPPSPQQFDAKRLSMTDETGYAAVKSAVLMRNMKELTIILNEPPLLSKQRIGNQTFTWKDNQWTSDADTSGLPIFTIEYLSNAYFDLIENFPDMKKFISLGESVTFCYKDVIIKISEKGQTELSQKDIEKIRG